MASKTEEFVTALDVLKSWCDEQSDETVLGGEFFTSVMTAVELGGLLLADDSRLYTQARELADAIQAVKTQQENAAAILMSNMPQDVARYIK